MKPKHIISALVAMAGIISALANLAMAVATYYGPQRVEERRHELDRLERQEAQLQAYQQGSPYRLYLPLGSAK